MDTLAVQLEISTATLSRVFHPLAMNHASHTTSKRQSDEPCRLSSLSSYYIPIPGFAGAGGSGAGMSVTAHSVVRISDAMDAAF